MKKIKVLTALLTLLSPALTIPVNAEETTVVNEETTNVVEVQDATTDESVLTAEQLDGSEAIAYSGIVDPQESTASGFELVITVDGGQVIDVASIQIPVSFTITNAATDLSSVTISITDTTDAMFSIYFKTLVSANGTYSGTFAFTDTDTATALGTATASVTVTSIVPADPGLGTILSLFGDQLLADAVAGTLGKGILDTVTQAELDTVEYVSLTPGVIVVAGENFPSIPKTLSGIEKLTNLKNLSLVDSQISDLSPIAGLPIEVLTISNYENYAIFSEITDYTPITTLSSTLKQLTLMGQFGANFSFLSSLTNLDYLSLAGNDLDYSVTSISGLSNIERLDLAYNYLVSSDIPAMLPANVQHVNVDGNMIDDLSVFANVDTVVARGQVIVYLVGNLTTAQLASGNIYVSNTVKAANGSPIAPTEVTAGYRYDASDNNLYAERSVAHNDELALTFSVGNSTAPALPTGPVIANEETSSVDAAKTVDLAETGASVDATNTYSAFSGVVVYKFKASDVDTVVTSPTLPETGINNYGMLLGTGSLAISALAMVGRKKIRK